MDLGISRITAYNQLSQLRTSIRKLADELSILRKSLDILRLRSFTEAEEATQRAIDELHKLQHAMENELIDLCTLVSPIRRLPVEILEQIILWACHDTTYYTLGTPTDIQPEPRIFPAPRTYPIPYVCRQWLEVVKTRVPSLPGLVVNIHPENDVVGYGLLDNYLSRSTHVLDVRVSMDLGNWHRELNSRTLRLLATSRNRWRAAHLSLIPALVTHHFHHATDYPQLEELYIRPPPWATAYDYQVLLRPHPQYLTDPFLFINEAPHLRTVYFEYPYSPATIDLPWKQLRELTIDGFQDSETWCLCLDDLTALQSLRIVRCQHYLEQGNTPPVLPALRHLALHDCDDHLVQNFTCDVSMPALESVELIRTPISVPDLWQSLQLDARPPTSFSFSLQEDSTFVESSETSISEELFCMLRRLASVESLSVQSTDKRLTAELLRMLAAEDDEKRVVPNLKRLSLVLPSLECPQDLVEMASARYKMGLACLFLNKSEALDAAAADSLYILSTEGLDIYNITSIS